MFEGEWRAAMDFPGDDEAVRRLAVAAHSLAGTAPMFGLAELGAAARELQREAEAVAEGRTGLRVRLAALGAAIERVRERAAS